MPPRKKKQTPKKKKPVKKKTRKEFGVWVICHKCFKEADLIDSECDGPGRFACHKCLGIKKRPERLDIGADGEKPDAHAP